MIYYIAQTEQTPEMQLRRLALARTLEANGIPCVVWAEDALAFIHCVPTGLFRLQLLVRDEDMERAISVITSGGQYLAVPSDPTDRDIAFDPSKSLNSFPDSVYLELENEDTTLPREALIHPQSFFHFDLHDKTRVLENLPPTVPTLNQKLRFPTLGAFLDSLVEMILDPTTGRRHLLLNKRLSGYVEYLVDYNVRTYDRVDVQGHPIPEAVALIASARPENRPFIEDIIFLRLPRDWGRLVDERRAILGDKVTSPPRPVWIPPSREMETPPHETENRNEEPSTSTHALRQFPKRSYTNPAESAMKTAALSALKLVKRR